MMHGVGKIGLKANFGFSETTLCLVHAIQNPHECHHRKYENLQMAPRSQLKKMIGLYLAF